LTYVETFAFAFDHNLLAEHPVREFGQSKTSFRGVYFVGPETYLRKHLGTIVFHRTRASQGESKELSSYLNGLADNLSRFARHSPAATEAEKSHLRNEWLFRLSQVLARTNKEVWNILFGVISEAAEEALAHFRREEPAMPDLLVAAAALSSAPAVQHFLDEGTKVFTGHLAAGFGSPLIAAPTDAPVLQLLLNQAEHEIESTSASPEHTPQNVFAILDSAIRAALDAKSAVCAIMLIDFAEEHSGKRLAHQFSSYAARAAESGSIELVDYFMLRKPNSAEHVILKACEYGQLTLVRHLLSTKVMIPPPGLCPLPRDYTYTPLRVAVQNKNRALVNLLIEFGADLTPDLIICALTLPRGSVFPMMQHLFQMGCSVNRKVVVEAARSAKEYISKEPSWRYAMDRAKSVVLIAYHIKDFSPEYLLWFKDGIEALKHVADGRYPVPTEPLPFQNMAREFLEGVVMNVN